MTAADSIDPGAESDTSAGRLTGNAPMRLLIENVVAMYGLWGATMLTGVALLPILTRRLGPIALGKLSVSQSLGWVIATMVEYGFNFYAAREVARLVGQDGTKAQTFAASIIGAKTLLLALLLPAFWWISAITPALKTDPLLACATALWILGLGSSPIWLFQGLGRIRSFTIYDLACKIFAVMGIFITVRRPVDAWLVQLWLALGVLGSTVMTFRLVSRYIVLALPNLRSSVEQLRLGWTSFMYRLSGTVAGQVNPFLMSASTTALNIGLYAIAEKVVRLCINALQPLSEAIYPFVLRSPSEKSRLSSMLIIGLNTALGAGCFIVLFACAAPVIKLVGGGRFAAAAASLRILSWSVPLVALNQALALYGLVRNNRTVAFTIFTGISLGTQVLLGIRLSATSGHVGMAKAVLFTQAISTMALITIISTDRYVCGGVRQYRS
jgi:PST family polysaccharide transporter